MDEHNTNRGATTSRKTHVRKISGDTPIKKVYAKELRRPSHLTWAAKAVLGLNGMGVTEPVLVAEALGMTSEYDILQVTKFIERLRSSKNLVIVEMLKGVLPLKYAVGLPGDNRVCCVYCGKYASYVPCVNCSPEERESSREVDTPLLPCTEPTSHLPGTIGKLQVMADRVARGEAPCHPKDAGDYKSLDLTKEW